LPRKSKDKSNDPFTCPVCGVRVSAPERTWTLVSPIPDREGRVTITIMGAFRCPNGHTWKAVIKKFKSGEEAQGEVEQPAEKEEGEVITLDISDIQNFNDEEPRDEEEEG
jgi:hypothetical protein